MKENKDKNTPLIEDDEDSYGKSDKSHNNSFDEGKIQINSSNEQILKERKVMIQDFKKISAQVSDLSKTVVIELKKQGEKVTRLEDKAKEINEKRVLEKKKPLKWAENIVNRVTDGCQGEKKSLKRHFRPSDTPPPLIFS